MGFKRAILIAAPETKVWRALSVAAAILLVPMLFTGGAMAGPLGDYGDAPDTTGNPGVEAYPGVPGGFPSFFDTKNGPSPDHTGVFHLDVTGEWLGTNLANTTTIETDALMPDGDVDDAEVELVYIDGPPAQAEIVLSITSVETGHRYLNVLLDQGRDGRWTEPEDYIIKDCKVRVHAGQTRYALLGPFPLSQKDLSHWIRMTITKTPLEIPEWDGSIPPGGLADGETEDQLLVGVDINLVGPVGGKPLPFVRSWFLPKNPCPTPNCPNRARSRVWVRLTGGPGPWKTTVTYTKVRRLRGVGDGLRMWAPPVAAPCIDDGIGVCTQVKDVWPGPPGMVFRFPACYPKPKDDRLEAYARSVIVDPPGVEFDCYALDSIYTDFIEVYPTIKIEKTHNTYQGRQEEVSITIENGPFDMGGFDFLIAYDASALSFVGATKGQLLDDCDWEYFTYRYGADDNCGDGCPSGLVRLIAIADMPNGTPTPSCFGPPDWEPHELFSLKFLVTEDMTFEGQYIPIKFFWIDCGDNTISSVDGQTLYLDQAIYDFTGNLLWDEDDDDQFPEDARPQGLGAPDVCLEGGGPDKPTPMRWINFWGGGIDIIPIDSIDVKGDINLNGVANEIADAVLFANYFIFGPSVWDPLYVEAQTAATDINNDGVVLTIADLVYLIRIITGDASPYPKLSPEQLPATIDWRIEDDQLVVDFVAEAEAGAILLAFDHHGAEFGEPVLESRASSMTMISHNNGAQLRVLLYGLEQDAAIASGEGTILTVPIIAADPGLALTESEAADYHGNMMTVEIMRPTYIPDKFALFQNVPNPFNATTRIDFNLPEADEVTLIVYDVLGRKVATLVDDDLEAGVHHITWNSRDDFGDEIASGVYFYRITTNKHQASRKMVLLK